MSFEVVEFLTVISEKTCFS